MKRRITRLWPLALAVAGIGMLAWSGWRMVAAPPGDDAAEYGDDSDDEGIDEEEPPKDLLVGERFEEVRELEVDVYREFKGRARADGTVDIRAPQGMSVPVVKIHAEHGVFVDEGDPLLTLDESQIVRAIAAAETAGDDTKVARFRGYLEHVVLRAPVDAQVLRIFTEEGQVPFDEGIPLMTLTDRSKWSFVVLLPEDVARVAASIGTKLEVMLEADLGTVQGTVNSLGETSEGQLDSVGGYVSVVLGLAEHEGIEADLAGVVRIPTSSRAAALVPKRAVEWSGDIPIVRVWEDGGIMERTLKLDGEHLDDYIAVYGVSVGERIVVPTPADE